ncbi:MAG: response regulator transcription factor [Deltaproteobacteria bacterium]|nr:response regulator transcription factor [Deltaproteobacteria bacterium]
MTFNHPYKIILADDHALVRKGIKRVIEEDLDLQVIGEAGDGLELLEILESLQPQPDLVVCDIAMPRLRGLEACLRVKKRYPHIKVLILSMHKSREYLAQAKAAGVDGYLLKDDADTALYTAIQEIRHGNTFFSSLISD